MKRMSGIINYPEFKAPPKSDAATVRENIDNWIQRNALGMINSFLRPATKLGSYKGYRFVEWDDLTETIITRQTISGLEFRIIHSRAYHTKDHMNPLWFSVWWDRCQTILEHDGDSFDFQSDAHLKRYCKSKKQTT